MVRLASRPDSPTLRSMKDLIVLHHLLMLNHPSPETSLICSRMNCLSMMILGLTKSISPHYRHEMTQSGRWPRKMWKHTCQLSKLKTLSPAWRVLDLTQDVQVKWKTIYPSISMTNIDMLRNSNFSQNNRSSPQSVIRARLCIVDPSHTHSESVVRLDHLMISRLGACTHHVRTTSL